MLIELKCPKLPDWETFQDFVKATKDKLNHLHMSNLMKKKMQPALEHQGSNDYVLKTDQDSVWIKVDEISIYIRRGDNAIISEMMVIDEDGQFVAVDTSTFYKGHES